MYETRSSVSRLSWPAPAYFHAKNVERGGLPKSVRASSALSFQASAMRKNVRSAGPDSRSKEGVEARVTLTGGEWGSGRLVMAGWGWSGPVLYE
jgi:hypothetical protein